MEYGLVYGRKGSVQLAGFTDANWAACVEDRKSTSGCFSIGSEVISLVQQEAEVNCIELGRG